mgnify:FL=1
MNCFYKECDLFSITINLKKTQVMCQGTAIPLAISVKYHQLEVVCVGSTTTNNLSLEVELDKRIDKATATLSKLSKEVWENKQLTANTKDDVYKACVINTLLYGSESWASHAVQRRKQNVFHLRFLHWVLWVSWQVKGTNNDGIGSAGIPSMYTVRRQRCLRWLGHVHRMEDGRIPKNNMLYGELTTWYRDKGRPQRRLCKRGECPKMDYTNWESMADNRGALKQELSSSVKKRGTRPQRNLWSPILKRFLVLTKILEKSFFAVDLKKYMSWF